MWTRTSEPTAGAAGPGRTLGSEPRPPRERSGCGARAQPDWHPSAPPGGRWEATLCARPVPSALLRALSLTHGAASALGAVLPISQMRRPSLRDLNVTPKGTEHGQVGLESLSLSEGGLVLPASAQALVKNQRGRILGVHPRGSKPEALRPSLALAEPGLPSPAGVAILDRCLFPPDEP